MRTPSRLFLVIALCFGATTSLPAEGLKIVWVDVEGGAATLLVTPAGESVLVDSGNPGRRDPQRVVKEAAALGLRKIDHLVTTHFHIDHYGGAATLAELMPIGVVYDNGEFPHMPDKPDRTYWEFPCEKRVVLQPGDKLPLKKGTGPEFEIVCLGTRQEFASDSTAGDNADICSGLKTKDRDGSDNANSVVLLVKFGDFRFFDAGDLTWNVENKLVCPKNLVGPVDVYQVTHHGLDASNNPLVIQSLAPTVAVMNNGATKGCMPAVFESLQAQKTLQAVYQTHKNLRPDGTTANVADTFIANSEKECAGNPIHLTVTPDATRYTVAIPATKHEKTFETRKK